MSDRPDTPSWDDDVPELVLSGEDNVSEAVLSGAQPTAGDEIEAMSENVLGGWPAADEPPPMVDEPAADDPPPRVDEAVADAEPGPEAAPALPGDPPAALVDHVSATMEHAPGDLTVPPGFAVLEGEPRGEHRSVGVVVARFNGDVTTRMLESALAELEACGVAIGSITVMPVPGAFELPLAAMALAKTRRFACIIALGCVIRGDTPHFDYVSSEAASGLQLAGIETGVPVSFGVLTLDRADQADSRVDKGAEAVRTALEMADLFANLRAAAAR
jgi:6,7-dimethyl-8-ribityllumazine synthase